MGKNAERRQRDAIRRAIEILKVPCIGANPEQNKHKLRAQSSGGACFYYCVCKRGPHR
jgi:hypothetical protein